MWPDPQETADLVTFTEEILNGKLHFLCSERFLASVFFLIVIFQKFANSVFQTIAEGSDKLSREKGSGKWQGKRELTRLQLSRHAFFTEDK